jgi:phosphatidylglycerophosphate synthase
MSRELVTPRWSTLANLVTASRVASVPVLVVSIVNGATLVALALFAFAVVTDLADGRLARNRGEASSLGGLFDHSADALLCSLGLGAFAWVGVLPAPLPFLVAAAFLQYVLDSRSIAGQPLRASFLGRWNGILYFVLLGVPIVRDALGLGWPAPDLVLTLGWTLVASTLVSMADRFYALVRRSSP